MEMSAPADGVFLWTGFDRSDALTDLADRLRQALRRGQPLVLDLSAAGEPPAAAVQLLVAATRAGDAFVLRNPSSAFVDGCSALGLFSTLMAMPMEASP
jgi:hypothetical protein